MSDADKIGKLSRRWSKMYAKVCEGYFDSILLSNDAMKPLRKDIEDYGNPPIRFLKEASNRLEGIRKRPLFLPIYNWNEEDHFIHDLKFSYMRKYRPNQRGMNLAISAYKNLVHKFRNGENIDGNLEEALVRDYIRRIYDSRFGDLILTLELPEDVDRNILSQRLNEMDIFVDENIEFLASQIARKGKVRRLSSRSAPRKIIALEDDVFNLGR